MAFKKNVKNTIINVAEHWGPDKSVAVILGTVLGAVIGGLTLVVAMDNEPMHFIENNDNKEEL
jgi:hypothetical protein